MRCPECSKFVSMETSEPEVQSEELSGGSIAVEVHLTRECTECSTALKETTFSLEEDLTETLETHMKENHKDKKYDDFEGFELELDSAETTESGGGRYKKNMIGVSVPYTVRCTLCDKDDSVVASGDLADSVQASAFDECC